MDRYDVLVIGGGIAGVSVGYELAADRSVCLLEMEATLAFHTTGRSAAMFLESYGGPIVRQLTVASRSFFEDPPEGFDRPLLLPRPLLWLGRVGAGDAIRALETDVRRLVPSVRLLDPDEAVAIAPILRRTSLELCLLEPDAMELDVNAVHQGFARGLRRQAGDVRLSSGVVGLSRIGGVWRATTRNGDECEAPVVVNASGAWGDHVAALAGVAPIGLRPLRRTLFTIPAPEGVEIAGLPLVADVDETFYLKPEGSQFLCSPADETPSPPCDASPEEIDIALALDRIRDATILEARHVRSAWAGLRTFTIDRAPVACYDPEVEGFFWLVGQGGYGLQTAPALARVTASLVRGSGIPRDLAAASLTAAALHRDRLVGRGADR